MLSQNVINQISGIVLSGATTVITGLAVYALKQGVSYLSNKKDALIQQNGIDKYNATYTIAKGIFYQAEQAFKLIPGAGNLKADMFDKLLLAKVPGLTQDEIDHFREAVVGEFNSQIHVTSILAPAFDDSKDSADVNKSVIGQTSAVNNTINEPVNKNIQETTSNAQ